VQKTCSKRLNVDQNPVHTKATLGGHSGGGTNAVGQRQGAGGGLSPNGRFLQISRKNNKRKGGRKEKREIVKKGGEDKTPPITDAKKIKNTKRNRPRQGAQIKRQTPGALMHN